jgi:hypothetical protein
MKLNEFNEKLLKAMNVASKAPYISVNKLAEYMKANPTRRRAILKTLKEDKDYTKVWYSEVKNVLPSYFESGYDNSILDKAIVKIEKKKGTTAWNDVDNPNSVQALECLKNTSLPDLSDYEIKTPDNKLDHVMLAEVKVLIRPEFYLTNKYSKKIGAIKFHYSKTKDTRLDLIGMQHVAIMIKYGFMTLGHAESDIDNNGCISVDIFEQNFGTAPNAYKRHLDSLTAACEEIAAVWSIR